jgi:hypothetical protein
LPWLSSVVVAALLGAHDDSEGYIANN